MRPTVSATYHGDGSTANAIELLEWGFIMAGHGCGDRVLMQVASIGLLELRWHGIAALLPFGARIRALC